jgi:hypothetical protein
MTKIEIEMMEALAAYSGPVKRYRPGKARGADLPKKDDRAQQWLNAHRRNTPIRATKLSAGSCEWSGLSRSGSRSGTRLSRSGRACLATAEMMLNRVRTAA